MQIVNKSSTIVKSDITDVATLLQHALSTTHAIRDGGMLKLFMHYIFLTGSAHQHALLKNGGQPSTQ